MILTVKRGEAVFAAVEIDENTKYSKRLMGEHLITGDFYSKVPLIFQIGDYIEYDGECFIINRPVNVKKINNLSYKYKIAFEGEVFTLNRKKLRSSDGLVEFPYVGTALDHLNMLLTNINEIDAGWTIGEVDETKDVLIDYNSHSCRTALTEIAKQFELEYSLNGKEISLKKEVGQDTAYTFEYGKGKGLYELEIKEQSNANIVTRMYGYGGTKNIPYDYRDRSKRLVFEVDGKRYLEKNILLYGIREGDFKDDKIFPQRTSVITGVNIDLENKQYYVEDSNLNFDINDNLLEGMPAKIIFKSGQLTNLEFEIWKYDHENKRIYFNQYSEADGYVYPNDLNKPAVGNEYTLVNMDMPQEYFDDSEAELQVATQASLDKNCVPQVLLGLKIDPKYIKKYAVSLDVGYRVTAICAELGINDLIRIYDLSFPLVNSNEITCTIANHIPYTDDEITMRTSIETKKEVVNVDRRAAELSRQNAAAFNQLKNYLIDADGVFNNDLFTVKYLQALLAIIGTSAANFSLSPKPVFLDNYEGDVNAFYAPVCDLIHNETSIEILDQEVFTWSIENAGNFSELTPETAYHLYAKCSKSVATAEWVLSPDIIASNQDNDYYFLVGTLHPVSAKTAVRLFKTSYGVVYINAGEIVAGTIRSLSGLNFLGLDNDQIKLGGFDVNVSAADTTTLENAVLKGIIVQSTGGATSGITIHRGAFDPNVYYYKDEVVTYGGSTWRFTYPTTKKGYFPYDGSSYWALEVAKGEQGLAGDQGIQGVRGANGLTTYFHIKYSDSADGSNMNEDGGKYIGTYTSFSYPDSDDPSDYNWVLVKGADGDNGSPGMDGVHAYTHIKYSNDGVSFTGNNGEDIGDWIGIYHDNTQLDSSEFGDYAWKKIRGNDGNDGNDGATGETGASLVPRGAYNSGTSYKNDAYTRDYVTAGSVYYLYIGADDQTAPAPPNAAYWKAVSSFEILATDILLSRLIHANEIDVETITALGAIIAGSFNLGNGKFIVDEDGNLTAASATIKTATSGQRVEIDSASGVIKFYNPDDELVASMKSSSDYGWIFSDVLEAKKALKLSPSGGVPLPLSSTSTLYEGTDGKLYYRNKDNIQTQLT